MLEGWIKLHRLLVNWEWYTTPNMVHFWIHCLLSANHSDGFWRGIPVKKGQFISGRKSLSANTGLSEQQIRTCIDRLKSTNELTIQSTNEYSVFTLISWEKHQITEPSNQQANQLATNEQPASNQQATTNKNENKEKKEKKPTVEFIPPTPQEVKDYYELKKFNSIDPKEWYTSRTESKWIKVNKEKVKDWKLDMCQCDRRGYYPKKAVY